MADIPALVQVDRPITLIPVGLKEAALDSPTFRSGFTHFSEQLDLVEKWLEGYLRCTSKLTHEVANFESLVNGFLAQTTPPTYLSEAVIDHDYTLLAMKRYGEGAKEFWTATISGLKKIQTNILEPIKTFLYNDLRSFRETRRNLHITQKELDNLQSRYSGQAKTKEASSLREDAFQLHEARKAYLKASMDFSVTAPQLRIALDKMLVKVFADQWRDMQNPRQNISGSIGKWSSDIERVRGWSREMENGEKVFRRELQNARKQIEESAEAAARPSRELEDYAVGPASASAARVPSTRNLQIPEKQGWLNLRTVSGKQNTKWLRRWFYVKNGIFGWLVQGSRSGGVEESERIGVLLCNVKPGNSDDRRYVFEVKTKDTTIVVQAETQPELISWIAAFDIAKQKALEDPASTESPGLGPRAQDPAFAISPPSAPEFAASAADSGMPQHTDENTGTFGVDRSSTLPVPGSSFDVSSHRRSFAERDGDASRDPASRIIQKLDIHRKPLGGDKSAGSLASPGLSGGGIASLIAASHTSMPVGPGALPTPPPPETPISRKSSAQMPTSTLAPNTLANPPAPTNLSAAAVIVNGDRGIGVGRTDASGGMPSGLMANIWGSTNWGHLNRLERGEVKSPQERSIKLSDPPSPMARPSNPSPASGSPPHSTAVLGASDSTSDSIGLDKNTDVSSATSPSHRKNVGLGGDEKKGNSSLAPEYPNYYPLQLKTQDAQFRLLFPNVRREERVVLVFKATWSPNEQQEFPGRVYVTEKKIFFYSNHCGLILITNVSLDSISEITAATGKECDFIFCHLKNNNNQTADYNRITIKVFLEPLGLLQRRLNFLVRNRTSQGVGIEEIMKTLIKMEQDDLESSPSIDSWENVSINTPTDGDSTPRRNASHRDQRDMKASVLIDRDLYGSTALQLDGAGGESSKAFKLPKQPIIYAPSGMDKLAVEKEFDVSPKALFHVLFGDKSVVWQLLYHERRARHIKQGPWLEKGHLRRDFEYQIEYLDTLRRVQNATVEDHQMVEVANEHLLYVVSDRKKPWHLPHRDSFLLLTKVVITHLQKSKCKLAIYTKVDWIRPPPLAKSIVAEAALKDLELDALDLADVIADQVRNFASAHGRTKKAIQIFGPVGLQTQVSLFTGNDAPLKAQLRRKMRRRTLTALAFESLGSLLESIATSVMQILFDFVRWTWRTIDANSVLLAILATSVLLNIIFSSAGTSEWWRERKAGKFMTGLGIGPDLTMSKAIYLHELPLELGLRDGSSSQCRDTFESVMIDAQQIPFVKSSQTPAAHRLQRSREHLGLQRHDLLVAMRVVNSIEREMVQAEWENWLLEENVKCKHSGTMLSYNTTELSAGKNNNRQHILDGEPQRLEELRAWQQQYCESCNQELKTVGI